MSPRVSNSPYRVAWNEEVRGLAPSRDLAALAAVVWGGSIVRVAIGVAHHGKLESELVLAAFAVFALPIALMKS